MLHLLLAHRRGVLTMECLLVQELPPSQCILKDGMPETKSRSQSRDRIHNSDINQLPDLGSLSPFHSGSDVDRSEY